MTFTVRVQDVAVGENESISLSSMIASIDADSDSDLTKGFLIEDFGGGTGHFIVNGSVQPNGQLISVNAADLDRVQYVGGSTPGADKIFINVVNQNDDEPQHGGTLFAQTNEASGDPEITGTPGNDIFHLPATGVADDSGGGGHDISIVPVSSANYLYEPFGDTVAFGTLTQNNTNFFLQQIENVQFNDKSYFIENHDNANIARLYSAAFDRVPDASGLFFWEDVYANNVSAAAKAAGYYVSLAHTDDGSGTSIAGGFMQSSEFINRYGALSDSSFVIALYQNVLGRGPDQAGLNFWLDQIEHQGQTREIVLVGFAESPENVVKSAAWLIGPDEPVILPPIEPTITSVIMVGQLPTTIVTGNDSNGGLNLADSTTDFGDELAQPGSWSVPGGGSIDLTKSATFGTADNNVIPVPDFGPGEKSYIFEFSANAWAHHSGGGGGAVLGLVDASLARVVGAPYGTTTSNAIIQSVTSGSIVGGSGNTGADVIEITDATFANAAALAKALASGSYHLAMSAQITGGTALDMIFAYSDGANVHIADVNLVIDKNGHPADSAINFNNNVKVHVSDMIQLTGVSTVTSIDAHNIHFVA